jgi:phage replication O-like protein O
MDLKELVTIYKEKTDGEAKEEKFEFPVSKGLGELSGFTGIPNRFLIILARMKLTPTELSMMLILYRVTIGYWRNSKRIKQITLMRYLGVSKTSVSNALNNLNRLGIITYKGGIMTVHDVENWNLDLAA